MSMLGLKLYFPPYLRSAMERFPFKFVNEVVDYQKSLQKIIFHTNSAVRNPAGTRLYSLAFKEEFSMPLRSLSK